MPIYWLEKNPGFPPATQATREGIIAIGGELTPEWLISAYSSGIFPWFNEGDPILWWSPTPRMLLFPPEIHISRSMEKIFKKKVFHCTLDRNFPSVIDHCRQIPRQGQGGGTWITEEMRNAYISLHDLGFAHSLEVWNSLAGKLAGGLYGVSLGHCFFGESMFSLEPNASKYAFISLACKLKQAGFAFIDCQMHTPHLQSLGARAVSRKKYLAMLESALLYKTIRGKWHYMEKEPVPRLEEIYDGDDPFINAPMEKELRIPVSEN